MPLEEKLSFKPSILYHAQVDGLVAATAARQYLLIRYLLKYYFESFIAFLQFIKIKIRGHAIHQNQDHLSKIGTTATPRKLSGGMHSCAGHLTRYIDI